MKRDMTKCWNCGSDKIQPAENIGSGWYQCPDCGATDHVDPIGTPTSDSVTQLTGLETPSDKNYGSKHRRRAKPSPSLFFTSEVTE